MTKHETEINALIPSAVKIATAALKGRPKTDDRAGVDGKTVKWDFWTEEFHKAMNRLTREVGLRYL